MDERDYRRGFTLLEMLLAMALMSMLAASLYASLNAAFGGKRTVERALAPARRGAAAMAMLQADIESAVAPTGVLAGEFVADDEEDAAGEPADILLLHTRAPDQSRWEPRSPIVRLQILPAWDEETDEKVLVRRTTVNLLAPEAEEPAEAVLCRGVRSFDLAFYDGTDWVEKWDSTVMGDALPPAVEVTLVLAGNDPEEDYMLQRTFALPCGGRPDAGGGR